MNNAPEPQKDASSDDNDENVVAAVNNITKQLEMMETFVSRKFDEISAEIYATSEQIDMNEGGIINKFAEVLEILSAISFSGTGDSAANSGVELEAVIEDTEDAANKILDAADRISGYVSDDVDWSDATIRKEIREKIKNDIQAILMACTFQDLTGQRIRNTLNNLHQIESRLSSTFERLGIEVEPDQKVIDSQVQKVSNQSEIDALLKGFDAGEKSTDDKN